MAIAKDRFTEELAGLIAEYANRKYPNQFISTTLVEMVLESLVQPTLEMFKRHGRVVFPRVVEIHEQEANLWRKGVMVRSAVNRYWKKRARELYEEKEEKADE